MKHINQPTWWTTLVETALLGTERRAFEPRELPTELQPANVQSAPETQLLQSAALATNYLRAGTEPLQLTLPSLPICEPEPLSYAPLHMLRLLDDLLLEQTPNRQLLAHLLRRCRERGWVLPPDKLTRILSRRKKGEMAVDPDDFAALLGNRGRWLAQFNPDWQLQTRLTPDEEWAEKTGIMRALALFQIRRTNSDKGRLLLEEAWDSEPLSNKKQLLNALGQGLSAADSPFLEKIRADLASVKKPRPTQIELYEQVTEILLGIPGSAVFDEAVQGLKRYAGESTGMLAKLLDRDRKRFGLPSRFDDFFAAENMTRLGAVIQENLSESLQVLSLFLQLLFKLHPSAWPVIMGDKAGPAFDFRPVPFFMRQPWIKGAEDDTVKALEMMITTFEQAEWVIDLLPHRQQVGSWPDLLALLPPDQQQAILQEHFDLIEVYGNYQFLTQPSSVKGDPAPWSLPFSEYVWKAILNTWVKRSYLNGADQQFFRDSIVVIHPNIVRNAEPLLSQIIPESQQPQAHKQLLNPLKTGLVIRQAIDTL